MWTATGSMATGRDYHTATLLPNGQVLVAGGSSTIGILASAELYDPATGMWTATGSMATARVRITRRRCCRMGRCWWPVVGPLPTLSKRGTIRSGDRDVDGDRQPRHCTRDPHGDVAAERAGAGGRRRRHQPALLASAELYDPATGSWTATASLIPARSITRRRCCVTARYLSQEEYSNGRRPCERGTLQIGATSARHSIARHRSRVSSSVGSGRSPRKREPE